MPSDSDPAADRLRDVADALPGVVFQARSGPGGALDLLFLSRSVADLFALPPDELLRRGDALVLDEDRDAFRASLRHAAAGPALWDHEFRVAVPGGLPRWLRGRAQPRREAAGTTLWTGFLLDVTEHKQTRDSLRRSEELYRLLTEAMGDVVSLHDPDGRLTYITPSVLPLTGYTAEEALAAGTWHTPHPDDVPALRRAVEASRRGEPARVEWRCRRKDGSFIWVESVGRPVAGPGGAVERVVVSSRDLTERKRLEEQFLQAQKMEALGRLAAGVAHDFNNLLTVINGYCSLLLDGPGEAPARDILEEIARAGDRAAALTQQLLTFGRRQETSPAAEDVNAVVADVRRLLRRVIREDVEIVYDLAPGPISVLADPRQFEQVLVNLAVNARDAMPTGGRLTVSTAAVALDEAGARDLPGARPGRWAVVAVADTGVGMGPEVRAHLFEPFFTTKPEGRGTGLRLATVYGIVTQAGGFLTVDSEPGRGSTFRVWLPQAAG
jgi:PAS domain S-box-containing protein